MIFVKQYRMFTPAWERRHPCRRVGCGCGCNSPARMRALPGSRGQQLLAGSRRTAEICRAFEHTCSGVVHLGQLALRGVNNLTDCSSPGQKGVSVSCWKAKPGKTAKTALSSQLLLRIHP